MEILSPIPRMQTRNCPVLLAIMDGIGHGPDYPGNAVAHAYKPHLEWLALHHPPVLLKAHGKAVGMPTDEDMGNSEVGHNAIGSGRVFSQGATLVRNAIASGDIFRGATWKELVAHCQAAGSTFHFIGLLSDGNVHSHIDHLKSLIAASAENGIKRVRVHTLLDGRDVGETSALDYIDPFAEFLQGFSEKGMDYRIASGGGRMRITMDRYGAEWAMVKRGWDIHVKGEGRHFASAHEAIVTLRQETGAIDQDLPGFVIADNGVPVGAIKDGDAVVMFNFRGDRAMELCNAFEWDRFDKFNRGPRPDVLFAGMMEYDSDQKVPRKFLVNPPELDRPIGEYLAFNGVRQFAISETQKFGHVTYFFNGNRSGKFNDALEDYQEIPSDLVPFEQRPWMKAAEITDAVCQTLMAGKHRFLRLNYPNGDMVGHTGNYQAARIAVEAVDLSVGRLLAAARQAHAILILAADHGNADEMYEWDKKSGMVKTNNGKPKSKTSHTLNPVHCYLYDPGYRGEYTLTARTDLGISSLAATCLNCLGFQAPTDYDPSLIKIS